MLSVYDPYTAPNVSEFTVTYGTVRPFVPHEMFFRSIAGVVELPCFDHMNDKQTKAFESRQKKLSSAYLEGFLDEEDLINSHDIIHGWKLWGTIPGVTALFVTNAPSVQPET